MNKLLTEIYSTREVLGNDGTPRNAFPTSLPYEDGLALHKVVRETGSQNTFEIGMAYSISTLFILDAIDQNGGGHHIAIDPYQYKWWEGIGVLNVSRAGYSSMFHLIEALLIWPFRRSSILRYHLISYLLMEITVSIIL